jgi:hypothetical protein
VARSSAAQPGAVGVVSVVFIVLAFPSRAQRWMALGEQNPIHANRGLVSALCYRAWAGSCMGNAKA